MSLHNMDNLVECISLDRQVQNLSTEAKISVMELESVESYVLNMQILEKLIDVKGIDSVTQEFVYEDIKTLKEKFPDLEVKYIILVEVATLREEKRRIEEDYIRVYKQNNHEIPVNSEGSSLPQSVDYITITADINRLITENPDLFGNEKPSLEKYLL